MKKKWLCKVKAKMLVTDKAPPPLEAKGDTVKSTVFARNALIIFHIISLVVGIAFAFVGDKGTSRYFDYRLNGLFVWINGAMTLMMAVIASTLVHTVKLKTHEVNATTVAVLGVLLPAVVYMVSVYILREFGRARFSFLALWRYILLHCFNVMVTHNVVSVLATSTSAAEFAVAWGAMNVITLLTYMSTLRNTYVFHIDREPPDADAAVPDMGLSGHVNMLVVGLYVAALSSYCGTYLIVHQGKQLRAFIIGLTFLIVLVGNQTRWNTTSTGPSRDVDEKMGFWMPIGIVISVIVGVLTKIAMTHMAERRAKNKVSKN